MTYDRSARTFDGVEYAPGRKFKVATHGAHLDGMVPTTGHANTFQGWQQPLLPGDVVICLGYGPGWGGDPGYGIEFTSEAAGEAGAFHCEIRPMTGGMWNYRPRPGLLEPIERGA